MIKFQMANSKKVVRPRYYSTELGIKEKLLVAIISSPAILEEVGSVVNKTLAGHVDKVLFFADEQPKNGLQELNLPIIVFPANEPSYTLVSAAAKIWKFN